MRIGIGIGRSFTQYERRIINAWVAYRAYTTISYPPRGDVLGGPPFLGMVGAYTMKPYAFRLHFNRINMQRGEENVWTVHTHGMCLQGREVSCSVPLTTVFNPNGRQPRAYLHGRGRVSWDRGLITIT